MSAEGLEGPLNSPFDGGGRGFEPLTSSVSRIAGARPSPAGSSESPTTCVSGFPPPSASGSAPAEGISDAGRGGRDGRLVIEGRNSYVGSSLGRSRPDRGTEML